LHPPPAPLRRLAVASHGAGKNPPPRRARSHRRPPRHKKIRVILPFHTKSPTMLPLVLRLALLVIAFASAPLLRAQPEYLTPEQIEYVEKKWPGTKRTSTGIRYIILKEGDGPQPKRGDRV